MRVTQKRGGWLALTLTSGLFLAGTVAVASPAAAEDAAVEVTAGEAEGAPSPVELFVAPQESVISPDGADTHFRVLVRNTGEKSLPEGSIELSVGDALTGDSALEDPGSTDNLDDLEAPATAATPSTVIATETIGSTAGKSEQEFTITVPTANLPFFSTDPRGVYPLHATYLASDTPAESSVSAYTPIIWPGLGSSSGASHESINLTLVVPFVLPAEIHTMPTRSQLGSLTPGFNSLLDYAKSVQAVLAIDPRIIAAIRAYGTEAPQGAQDLLTRLEQSSLSSFLLQYGDADPAAQAVLGATELMKPETFDFISRFGDWPEAVPESNAPPAESSPPPATPDTTDEIDATAEVDATAEADSVENKSDPALTTGVPTLETLGTWESGFDGAWPAEGQVGLGTIALLRGAGLYTTVLRSDNVTYSGGPRATLGTGQAVITDAELDAGVRLTLESGSETERELGQALSTARLMLAAEAGVQGLVLGVDRGGFADGEKARELLEPLTSRKWVNTVSLDNQEAGEAQLIPLEPEAERLELLSTAQANEPVVLKTRSLLVNPEYLDGYQRMRLLTLFSTQNASQGVKFEAIAKRFAKRDNELRDGVGTVGTKHAQLVGVSSRIPIQVRNKLPFDAIINLTVAPASAVLSVPDRKFPDVVIPQDSTERLLVPVKSRVSSGESALFITVTDTSGEHKASTDVLAVSVSTNIEAIALSILGATAVLLFGFGIWRSVRRRRTPHVPTATVSLPDSE